MTFYPASAKKIKKKLPKCQNNEKGIKNKASSDALMLLEKLRISN
jgi:hypothetical protein